MGQEQALTESTWTSQRLQTIPEPSGTLRLQVMQHIPSLVGTDETSVRPVLCLPHDL